MVCCFHLGSDCVYYFCVSVLCPIRQLFSVFVLLYEGNRVHLLFFFVASWNFIIVAWFSRSILTELNLIDTLNCLLVVVIGEQHQNSQPQFKIKFDSCMRLLCQHTKTFPYQSEGKRKVNWINCEGALGCREIAFLLWLPSMCWMLSQHCCDQFPLLPETNAHRFCLFIVCYLNILKKFNVDDGVER